MRIPGMIRNYERSCDDCGYTWLVPRAIARPRKRFGTPSGYSISVAAGPGGVVSALRDRAALEQVERNLASARAAAGRGGGTAGRVIEDFARCTQCGSEEYSQRPLRS